MKEQDVERFIKALSLKSLVVSYKDEPVNNDYTTYTTTHYLIVKSAKYGQTWDNVKNDWVQTNVLRLDCSVDITITECSYDYKNKNSSYSRSVVFNVCHTFTPTGLGRLHISRTNRLPKDVERQVETYLNKQVEEARKQVEKFSDVLKEHNMSEATEGLE